MTVTWREAMNADIAAFFGFDESAEIIEIDTGTEDRGNGCHTCRWTVFIVEVTLRSQGRTSIEKYEGSLTDFLTAVSQAAETTPADADDAG